MIKINKETQRISLGMKQLQADPWDTVEAKFPIGSKHTGRVTNITDYGAFVELEPGVEGLVHVSEMSWTKKNVHPGKIVSTSQEVEVLVLEIDGQKRRVVARAEADPGQSRGRTSRATHPNGTVVEGEIKNITEFGLFIGLDGDIDGMVHLSDLDWNRSGEEAIQGYRKGDMVKAVVTDVDVEKERISLSIKAVGGDPFADAIAGVKRGDVVTVTVTAIEDGGIEVEYDGMKSFIRRSDLSRDRSEQRPERFTRGDKVDARVTNIDKARKLGPVDQGARDRRGEGGGGAVRLVRLGRLARRHPRRRPEAQGRRLSAWTRSNATSTRSGAANGAVPLSGGASVLAALIALIVAALRRLGPDRVRLAARSRARGQRASSSTTRSATGCSPTSPTTESVRALVLRINSPGGTTAGSEALFASIRRVAAEKPVVAMLGELAASGGYVAAIAADQIVARGNTLTGSIGVIMEYPEPHRPDGADRHRARDRALVRAQGRAIAVPPDQPGGARARRGDGHRELRLVPRPGRRAARPRRRRARRGRERRRSSPGGSRSRTG